MTNLDSQLKSRDFADQGLYSQTMVFPVVMYGCESWIIKKAEHWRIDAFELWCWRRLLRVPWTARISNQSMLKDINPEYSLEGLMLKPKLQYFGHLLQRADSLERIPMQGKIEGRRRRGWQRTRWLDVNADSVDMSLSELWEMVKDRGAWCAVVHGVAKSRTQLSNWTTTSFQIFKPSTKESYVIPFNFWGTEICFPQQMNHLTFLRAMYKGSNFSTSSSTLASFSFFLGGWGY